jgi:hypothetical protein
MRIEKRKIGSSKELASLVKEALEGEIKGFELIDEIAVSSGGVEMGVLAGDAAGRVFVVAAKEKLGDGLILSYGSHMAWLKHNKERLVREHPKFDWEGEPGVVLMAESFSPHVLTLASLLGVSPKAAYSMKCLGIGTEKGLYIETIVLPVADFKREAAPAQPVAAPPAPAAAASGGLLSRTVTDLVGLSGGLEVSASFGYRSKALDWVPVANLRSHRGTIWIESGPGKWTTKRVEDEKSLGSVLDVVKRSYDEIVKAKGAAKDVPEEELSEAEKKSLGWE